MRIPVMIIWLMILASCKSDKPSTATIFMLDDYPSGSAISFYKERIYLMGDDAAYLTITDTAFSKTDTIRFFSSEEKRIPKDVKQDLEAMTFTYKNRKPVILIVGSGATHARSVLWIVDQSTKEKRIVSIDTFYKRIINAGIKELNIEGMAQIPGGMVLAARGSKGYPKNHLIFTTNEFWEDQAEAPIQLTLVGSNTDTSSFTGISGLEYSRHSDKLLITTSTENTVNAIDDGEIGKSYLWFINDISRKRSYSGINPIRTIDLETIDSRFAKQKIESVCILEESSKGMKVVFAADDDKGGTVLFKCLLEEK